jgi:L-fucose isomerase-like protein
VVWHCGQAPLSLADPSFAKRATIHSNRRMPLLFEFPLKPGSVTLARLSQALGRTSMVIAEGEVLSAPPSFSGTSGVVRFNRPAALVRDRLIAGGVEHHLALVYGDHKDAVEHVAARLDLPLLDLTA